jgi:hypothetical protein
MQREAPRTLRSCLPPLQKAVSGDEYEVIVIDNGAEPELSLAGVDFGGVNVRLFRVPPNTSHPSPVFAINDCISRMANGRFVLVCIDGARLFSPYLVRRSLDALNRAPDGFTYVGSRHLGHEVQMKSVQNGYDQDQEDKLLQSVDWTHDLDRLNEISVWAGAHSHGNAFTQNESNAFALQRAVWQEIGMYNTGFMRPGGGLCNLEIFNRLVERPNAQNILLWGESTFHQVHGGAATSKSGYFAASQEEFKNAVGSDYQFPSYNFEVDKGIEYGREAAIGKWYYK